MAEAESSTMTFHAHAVAQLLLLTSASAIGFPDNFPSLINAATTTTTDAASYAILGTSAITGSVAAAVKVNNGNVGISHAPLAAIVGFDLSKVTAAGHL